MTGEHPRLRRIFTLYMAGMQPEYSVNIPRQGC
jgi:hypothetical protein